jgi:hypothetical protein
MGKELVEGSSSQTPSQLDNTQTYDMTCVACCLQRIAKMLSALTKQDHFSLFSSSFTNKTKTIIQLSQIFSIE